MPKYPLAPTRDEIMPEFWFRYGATEVSLEVPEEVSYEKIEVKELKPKEDLWRRVADFADDLERDLGSREVTIIYDYSGDSLSMIVLRHLVNSLEEIHDRVTIIPSHWRLGALNEEEYVRKNLKKYGARAKVLPAHECEFTEFKGMKVAKKLLGSSVNVIVTSSEPHGLLGKASIKEAMVLSGLLRPKLEESLVKAVQEAWLQVVGELELYAITNMNDRFFIGEAERVASEIEKTDLTVQIGDFDVVFAGCGGSPRDSSLQQVAHVVGLLKDSVNEEGLIGIIAECGRGLGSRSFLDALFGGGGAPLDRELVKLLRKVSEERRVTFTSALPKSILKELFGLKCFDVPQEMLTYALRIYSRSARILILEKPLVKPIRRKAED